MNQKQARILIADDEKLFLDTLADILKKEGFECDCAIDSVEAKLLIEENQYDLLIADIKMPGNEGLEFVSEVPGLAKDLPVILVTAYPSIETALPAFGLPVVEYFSKPLDHDRLLTCINQTVNKVQLARIAEDTKQQLEKWAEELSRFDTLYGAGVRSKSETSLYTFLTIAMQNIANSLLNLKFAVEASQEKEVELDICRLFDCPRAKRLSDGIKKSIKVMEKTKRQFKSKDLAILRDELEDIIEKEGI